MPDEEVLPIKSENGDQWPGELRLLKDAHGWELRYYPNKGRADWDTVAVALDFFEGKLQALVYGRDEDEPVVAITLMNLEEAHRGEEEIKRLEARETG